MTLPASGALSISAINTEFGRGNNLNAYRGTTWYTDAGSSGTFSAGAISMNEFYGKRLTSPTFSFTISSNQVNANLRSLAVAAGWNQSSAVIATINSGVYISSNSTGTPALTINGSFPGGVQLVNNGVIVGMGGNGGAGAGISGNFTLSAGSGSGGGGALSVSVGVTITNNNTIAGGGGGGGGSTPKQIWNKPFTDNYAGSGGGGGRSSNAANSSGGAGGSKNNFGSSYDGTAGGTGTVNGAGAGGTGYLGRGAPGGSGGGWGSSGGAGTYGGTGNGAVGSGGGGGYAVSGNGNISWAATGTRLGGIS